MAQFFRNYWLLVIFACMQIAWWDATCSIIPDMDVVPPVPGKIAVKALSFGDEEFYFRVLGRDLQNAGDNFGRFTELYKYDYKRLYAWFTLLDSLDSDSDYIPFLASYYFSQTQHTPDVRYVVDYLYEHSKDHPETRYWWLSQGAYLAQHKLHDPDLAIKVASPLEHADHAPFWVRELPAFVHEQRGEMDDALRIIENIHDHSQEIPPGELNFMTYFVKERLHRLEDLRSRNAPGDNASEKDPAQEPVPVQHLPE